ncbi:ATP-grasp domain-containing protein [Corynebacterium oculi]|uniref:ATP-grasp domain-containing protein n=1 Tax=Corynebacterium oculi TaxID=1544416 RepID=A0A0Q0U851_9CORY|nr:ATP-grasp domain-containing protein [Corynebacterium oculi]KQB83712.1 hypothetical protein Cocul_01784 [Corynebacterium oculi]
MKILVVDDSSSGTELVAALRQRGATVVTVNLPHVISADEDGRISDPWALNLLHECVQEGYDLVVPGSESGVSLAEWISAELKLPHNSREKIWHRRHKQGVIEVAHQHGLHAPKSVTITPFSVQGGFSLDPSLVEDCVVKPVGSGGSDHVYFCKTESETIRAINTIHSSTTLLGEKSPSVVIQEYVEGPQYFVNLVTSEGCHLVTEVFRYGIKEGSGAPHIYSAITVDPGDGHYSGALEYTLSLLDALGVRFGASHVELRWSKGRWVLIEYNGRCMGPEVPDEVYFPARGFSQISVLASMLTNGLPAAEREVLAGNSEGCVAWLMPTPQSNGVLQQCHWDLIQNFPTVRRISHLPKVGSYVDNSNRVTTGAFGMVFLGSSDRNAVEADLKSLEELDSRGDLYTVTAGKVM